MSKSDRNQINKHPDVLRLSELEYDYRRRLREYAKQSDHSKSRSGFNVIMHFRTVAQRLVIISAAAFITLFYPVGTYVVNAAEPTTETPTSSSAEIQESADTTDSAPVKQSSRPEATESKSSKKKSTKPKSSTTPGPKKPTGADSNKYTYNKETGMWENDKYAWNPETKQTKPKTSPDYSYNPKTGMWDSAEWKYDAPSGTYKQNVVSTAQIPDDSPNQTENLMDTGQAFDLYFNANISNNVNSTAKTGDAVVSGNTMAGDALSGDALVMANIINLFNSYIGSGGGSIATFKADIHGDVVGDLLIDPAALSVVQPASSNTNINQNLDVSVNTDVELENNINLSAETGNASVAKNTTAGNATTGDANAVANVVNLLNSAITSGSSFLGALNIYGNLNGDVLLPPSVLDTLLANNAPKTNLEKSNVTNTEILAEFTDNQTIQNNINLSAETGNASVTKNTTAGNATTGDAQTNLNVINLTGKNIVAANSLLVFVNVLGEWVGVIMDAPVGSSSAMLGTGVTHNTSVANNLEYDSESNSRITNNIDVSAETGNASVTKNTTAGNATTGDATASANVANIINSSFSLTDWFGLLFINVFGSWNGSFGVDTAAGNQPKSPATNKPKTSGSAGIALSKEDVRVFRFVPAQNGTHRLEPVGGAQSLTGSGTGNNVGSSSGVQTAATQDSAPNQGNSSLASTSTWASESAEPKSPDLWMPVIGFIAGGSLLGIERLTSSRNRQKLRV